MVGTNKRTSTVKAEGKVMRYEDMEWITLAQDRDMWLAILDTIIDLSDL